jgi:uncharacterized protein (TIGR02271 family)
MTTQQAARLQGQTAYDSVGQKLGEIQRVFYDQATNEPAWITIRGGMSARETFVPTAGSQIGPSGLTLPIRKDVIDGAPAIQVDNELSAADARRLEQYYEGVLSMPTGAQKMPTGTQMPTATGRATPPPPQQPEPARRPTETAQPVELTSHEERLRVGAEAVESGTVRLHKYVVTEPAETSVPVRHEEVSIERIPATEARPSPGHRFEEQAVEVTLHEERPTIAKETVPVETVRLAAKTQTDQRQVNEQVRRERIEVEDHRPGDKRTGGSRR